MMKSTILAMFAFAALDACALVCRNPIIWADVPDVSVCCDGTNYYMVSTTMHLMPGAPIMRSKDMKEWKTVSYVFPSLDEGAAYSLDSATGATVYGQGQWASSLRYHKGKFYCWFVCNGTRGFIYTASKAEGPWTLLSRPAYRHDGSLFFDDDGRVYIFHGSGAISELESDLSDFKSGGLDKTLFERGEETALLEGSSAFKKDGYYYLMMVSAYLPDHPRREVCYRATSLDGEWEKKVILETSFDGYGGVGQGCVVEGPDGKWRALVFQDRGGIGRCPCLMDVTWKDGWPILGEADGSIPNDESLPYNKVSGFVGSDGFKNTKLSLYWQWNHNPVDSAWSLKARRGWLRLTTPSVVPNIFLAPNTLTQRMVGPECAGIARFDVSGMKDGDRAGLAAFQSDSGVLAVRMDGGKKLLVMSEENSVFQEDTRIVTGADVTDRESVALAADIVWMRVRADFRRGQNWAEFDWSLDGKKWKPIGSRVTLKFDYKRFFMGTKFALFNYATKSAGGHVDIDGFKFISPPYPMEIGSAK